MRGSMMLPGLLVGAVLWITYAVGAEAGVVIMAFFAGSVVTVGVLSMTGNQSASNAKALASREKALDLRDKALIMRAASLDTEVRNRSKQLAGELFTTWKARVAAEMAAKAMVHPATAVMPAPPRVQVAQWRDEDL